MTFTKEELLKIWNHSLERAKELGYLSFNILESPVIESYGIKMGELFPENNTSEIQIINIKGEGGPRMSILINGYIEVSQVHLTTEEFRSLSDQLIYTSNESLKLEKERAIMAVECVLKDLVQTIN